MTRHTPDLENRGVQHRVMEKCGFTICGEGKGFAGARGQEVEDFILRLEASESVDSSGVEK